MRFPPHILAAIGIALVAGCTSLFPPSAPVRYYALEASPPTSPAACAVRFGLRPVALPGYADRDEIVIARQGTELTISNTELWAAPLRSELTRTLGESLQQRWTGSRYVPHPWRFGETPPWTVDIAFEQIDPAAGSLLVRARWAIAGTAELRPAGSAAMAGTSAAAGASAAASGAATAASGETVTAPPAAAASAGPLQPPAELASGRFEARLPLAAISAGSTAEAIARAAAQLADRLAEEGRRALAARESACR